MKPDTYHRLVSEVQTWNSIPFSGLKLIADSKQNTKTFGYEHTFPGLEGGIVVFKKIAPRSSTSCLWLGVLFLFFIYSFVDTTTCFWVWHQPTDWLTHSSAPSIRSESRTLERDWDWFGTRPTSPSCRQRSARANQIMQPIQFDSLVFCVYVNMRIYARLIFLFRSESH